jgi:Rrf2 family protein
MALRAKSHYAAVAMLELALRADEPQPVCLRDIAVEHEIPLAFLTQILQQLKVAGLVSSSRGSAGGYRLQRPASSISLAEIIDAVLPRTRKDADVFRSSVNQVLEQTWRRLEEASYERLRGIRLDQLVQQCAESPEGMFYI